MEKEILRINVQSFNYYDLEHYTIQQMIEYFNNVQALHPNETIKIDFDITSFYDGVDNQSKFYFEREETDKEYQLRLNNEVKRKDLQKLHDIATINRLRNKYGI